MSTVYFFRHGQAGSRDDYDRLSELGHEQATLLGAHVAREGWQFDRVLCGGLRRQQETAAAVLRQTTLAPPVMDTRWNEFDLDEVFAGIAPQMAADDPEFRTEYEEIERLVRGGDGAIHRQWRPADTKVVKAWIEGRYSYDGESWLQFVRRVKEAGAEMAALPADAKVAVFTSATPVSIWVAAAFASEEPPHVMKLAGAAINSNITVLRWLHGEPHLGCFNATPHLGDPRLRTFR
ncbi:MAG: histidine phosphatase family protein [Bryobacterales bacterium]|nr:histidine phosphatase family protein [Bryobacterales bacterium]